MEPTQTGQRVPFIKSKAGIIIISAAVLVVCFFGVMKYMDYRASKVADDALTQAASKLQTGFQSQTVPSTPDSGNEVSAIDKAVGDEVVMQDFKFKITGIKEEASIVSNVGTAVSAKSGAKFVVVSMDVINTDKTKLVFGPDDYFRLVDNQGRQFMEEDSNSYLDNSLEYQGLAPDIAQSGIIVYQIPNDATSYYLSANDSGSSQVYKVKLQ